MQQTCKNCTHTWDIGDEDLAALAVLNPKVGGAELTIPPPTHCPECRQQRRYACRNDRNYYPGTCHVCNKSLITSYSPDKSIPVLCDECFFGDKWDPLEYGRDIDFSRPFFEQFAELRAVVPRLAIYHTQSENSDYTVHSSRNKNCYMGSSLIGNEDVHYSDLTFESHNCLDGFSCMKMELCYECLFCEECFQCEYLQNCNNLSDSLLCFDCSGSDTLIGCIGLRNTQNKIFNKDASKKECQETAKQYKTDPEFRAEFNKKFHALKLQHPHRASWMINTEQCTGNYIWNSKNVHMGFNVRIMEDVRYAYEAHRHQNTYDVTRIGSGEMLYECASVIDMKYGAFCYLTYQCDNLLYCDGCTGTSNCFGSISLKKHKYCIFNKQYSEDEYNDLVPKIVKYMRSTGEWGEFFPITISVFGYNESKAHEWFPMEEPEVKQKGWKWSTYEAPIAQVQKTIPGEKLPDNIDDVPDDILNWAIICEESKKPFNIIKQELDFYRNRGLPVPHRSPKQRHYDRMRLMNIRTLYDRSCNKCKNPIQTIYAPERPEIVYCEECYLKEVY